MRNKKVLKKSDLVLKKMKEFGIDLKELEENYRLKFCPKSLLNVIYWGHIRVKVFKKNYFGQLVYLGSIMQNKNNLSSNLPLSYLLDRESIFLIQYAYCKKLESSQEQKRL